LRKILMTLVGLAFSTIATFGTGEALAAMASTEEALAQKVLGKADAPITILAFESLTCPHCAAFHRETLGQIKKNYIETGKAKLIFIDFPLDPRATVGSMLARCTGNDRFFGMIDLLYKQQAKWAGARDFIAVMKQMATLGGLNDDEYAACMKNEDLYNGIQGAKAQAQKEYDIHSTPTFVINGRKVTGAQPYSEFDRIMKSMLP